MMKTGFASRCLITAVALLALAVPASAGDRIPAGFDYWQTLGSGATRYSFASNPIPAGFFCRGSAPFKGVVNFEGVPLRTEPARILGTTDTVIERLDDAPFNAQGIAKTRIRGRALSLVGSDVKTSCGTFKVTAGLAGEQPVTQMIFRQEHEYGGTFKADLRLNVHVTFTHSETGVTRTLVRQVALPTVDGIPYAFAKATIGTIGINRCISINPGGTIEPGTLSDDVTILSGSANFDTDKRVVDANIITLKATGVATGCLCNAQGQCMPVYAWHDPCANNPNCERHFTHSPCELGYEEQCTVDEVVEFGEQLHILRNRGIITADPATVLRRQVGAEKN